MAAPRPVAPRVSVVIPTHDRAATVVRAVRSVLAQTFPDLDLIVVDDGSTDVTPAALAAIADRRLRVLHLHRNHGVSHARNVGVRAARGELVTFLDSDDEWLPGKLAAHVAHYDATARTPSLVYCGHWRQDARTGRRTPATPLPAAGDPFRALLRGWDPLPSCVCLPRATVLAAGGLDETLPAFADHDLWLRLADAGVPFLGFAESLVVKHEHGGPQISSDPERLVQAFLRLDAKWAVRIRAQYGTAAYRTWRARVAASIELVRVRRAADAGARGEAWRCVVGLARHARRSRRYLAVGLALAALGPRRYDRLLRLRHALSRTLGHT